MGFPDWDNLEKKTIETRRDLHRYPETGWTEFRTSSIVASRLAALGFDVKVGGEVVDLPAAMGRPSVEEIKSQVERALSEGADPTWIGRMNGVTGVLGTLRGSKAGPVVSLRFDMDCVDVGEAGASDHAPVQGGYASCHAGRMHACGHDAHTAIGLVLAEVLASTRDEWGGEVRLIFQPAEEGVRGGRAVAERGVVDGSDYFFGFHLYSTTKSGVVAGGNYGSLATSKIDADFRGRAAHAAMSPEEGRNALLAAATAVLGLHAIAPHSAGASRVNVGVMEAGTGRNVVPAHAHLKIETRGETAEIAEYVYGRAMDVLSGAAAMQDVAVEIAKAGEAMPMVCDELLVRYAAGIARDTGLFEEVHEIAETSGSEDASWLMDRVRAGGGLSTYLEIGAAPEHPAGHHNERFDIDESAMIKTVRLLAELVRRADTIERG